MGYVFLRTLSRDRAIDAHEYAFIEQLAERDRVVDDDERPLAERILRRIRRQMVDPAVWQDLERFKRRVGI